MYARRTESVDAAELEKLILPETIRIFGKANIVNIIEKSLLSVTLTVSDGDIIGFGAFYDYPRIPDYDEADDWNEIHKFKHVTEANANNSLFMHYFVSAKDREIAVLTEIINTVFTTAPDIHYIFITTPQNVNLGVLNNLFDLAKEVVPSNENFYILFRESYMPRLFIRPARAEDNDDLAPIFNAQTDVLKKIYGEFYIAEMIAAQNDNLRCFVGEAGGVAIGFMCVSKDCNVEMLNYAYYVEPFSAFKKENESEKNADETEDENELKDKESEQDKEEFSVPVVPIENALQDSDSSSESKSYKGILNSENLVIDIGARFRPLMKNDSIQQFYGTNNAMVVQLFAINELYEMRSVDFLKPIFEAFPTRDYLLMSVPHLVPEFPLLENFVRLTPRPGAVIPHEIYVFHKGNLLANPFGLKVRRACVSDDESIEKLIFNLKWKEPIIQDIQQYHDARRYIDTTRLYVFVAEVASCVVGLAVVSQEENIEYIRSHWNIEDFIYYTHHKRIEHGRLKHFVLNPIFKKFSKQFMKEVMRKSHYSTLYHCIYKPWAIGSIRFQYTLVTNMTDLVPVRPRRQINYNLDNLGSNAPTDRVLNEQEGCCLMHINRKLIMEPKVTVNARIVVVGASCTGLSFLEHLCFCPHLKFNNLFLVSPNGLPDDFENNEYVEQLMGRDFYFSKKKLEYSSMRVQVTVVSGKMTKIDRKKKFLTINNELLLPYDHMIIATGMQYTMPCPTEAVIKNLPTTEEVPNSPNRRYSELVRKKKVEKKIPKNFFTVNDPYEAVKLLNFVHETMLINNETSNIIIYGHCFEVYCCLHTLLAMGVQGYRIHFIKPPIDEDNYPLNNPIVEEAVYDTLREAGVHMHHNYCLGQFNDSHDVPEWIYAASFTTHGPPMRLDCKMFISYFKKVVNYDAFKAINDACLVFDSRLVIDSFFHTNDPCIRGAGPVTKFKRRYYSDQWNHFRFNSRIVGEELAKEFLRLFDPTVEPLLKPPQDDVMLIPMYYNAILKSAILPGGYTYLQVSKPSLPISLNQSMSQSNYGSVLETGHPKSEEGYFRVHLNQYKKVETITCLRKKTYPVENFIQLYGIHERALNNLQSRYNEGLIKDLYEFFSDTWANAFYHDRFTDLRDEIKELLVTNQNPCTSSFDEMIRKMTTDGTEITVEERQKLMEEFRSSGAKRTVDQRLISFIAYNHYHLPMYAKPDIV